MDDDVLSAINRANVLDRWAKTPDRTAAMKPLRDGFRAKLRAEVLASDPPLTDEAEIERRVGMLLRAHYERMRASSLKSRREAAARRQRETNDALEAAITEGDEAE